MRKSIDWKLGVFGIIALILALGLVAGDAVAAATGRITSGGRVIAGSTGNAIRIEITGATAQTPFSVTVPTGFPEMTGGNTDVTGGIPTYSDRVATITPAADTTALTILTINYSNVTVPAKIGRLPFEIRDPAGETNATSLFLVVVTADGSGRVLVNNQPSLEKTAGVPGETFKFLYTAIGTQAENPNSLDGGELQLEIPRGWPTPTSANIVVNGDPDGGDEGTTPPATVGTFRITGSGPWFITVPITAMGGTEEIQIEYKGVTVPFGTGTYHFPVGVKEFGGRLTQVASVSITVSVAGRGSGTMTVSGGPVAATSTGNQLTFVYKAAGTLDGGALELLPPTGWTEPQGSPGTLGYTTVTFSPGASGTPNFGEDKGAKRPDFGGAGVGILFSRMRVNDTVTIVYGAGGAGNGATAPAETGLSYFDVYVGPSYSHEDDVGIGSAEGQGTNAKIPNPPFVSVQSQAGTGTVTITAMQADGDNLVAVANARTINAGQKGALVFTFTATGDMNGGAFSVTVDNSWPNPTPDNTSVTTTGSTGNLIPRQKELIVPIVSLSATQTITVTYGGKHKDHRVTAPGVPEDGSVFTFKTRSTPTGTFVAIPDTSPSDQDPRNFEVKVTQAADGSGKVTLPVAQRTVSAGSTGNTFEITYTAVGQMNGGRIQLTVPEGDGDTWTPLSRDNLTVQALGLAVGEFSNNDRTVTYPITTLGKGDTVKFTYTGVEVQSTVSGDSDRDGVAGPEPKKVPLEVSVSGSKDAPLVLVGDAGEAMITVDNAADGSGTATIEFSSRNFSPIENDDVPANLEVDIAIKYTAIGDVSGADIVVDNPDNALKADPGLVSLELTIPVAFTLPQTDDADNPGYIEVSGGGGSGANLELFGRIVRVKNVLLARGSVITINYRKVLTPPARGNHPFTIRSQGRKDTKNTDDTDKDDRHLVALSAGSPQVTIGPVISGSGSAEIVEPELTGDPKLYKFIAGKPGATIQFVFTVPGRLDGGDVKLRAPAGWVAPGSSSGSKGYTTVFPSSGVRIGSLVFDSTEASVVIPIIEMGKDDKLTITYGAGGGASGVDVPQVAGNHQFVVETITRGGINSIETFETVAKDEAAENKLKITATALEGSGTFTPSPDNVPVSTNSAPRTARLTFTYKAAGNINTIGVTTPANWPTFKHPSSTESDGRVTVSRGELSGVTAEASAGNTIISVNKLNLTENDIVTITYDVMTPTVVGPGEFRVTSGSSESGGGSPAATMTVYVVSEDGSGKVASIDNDVAAVTSSNLNAVIGSDRRAGDKGDLVFFYNLASGEYIRSGELQITVPSTWSPPLKDKVEVKQFTASGSTDEVVEADRPTHESPGRVIIVAIKKQESGQPIRITFKEAVAPTRREDSRFRVISKSSSGGRLSQISKNRIDNSRPSEVIVKVVDGKNGSGSATVTHNGGSLSAVPSGSNNNVLRFVYTASAELSTRLSDGSVADRTDAGFASANINTMAGIQLQIPTGWARPNVRDTDGNSAGANVTVTGPRTAFFDFDPAQRGFDEDLVISPSEPYTISVPIRQLLPRQSITLTYGAGTDKAEAQGTKGDVKFLIKSKGGQQGDVFTGLPKGGQLAEIGELRFKVTPAGDGSGTITATVSTGSTGTGNQVYGGDSGIEITFTYIATGHIEPEDTGAFLRIVPPAGWTVPQGSPGLPGFTAQKAGNTPRLGAPTFDGVGATFPIPTITKDNIVTIVYGSGAQATAASGAVAPNQKSKALEEAPKFLVTMRGSASGSPKPVIRPGVAANYAFSGIPIEITNAESGTGTARVSPTETTAGHKGTYVVTYTALGPLFEGAVRLTIPTGWMVKDEGDADQFTAATFNKDTIVITSTGKLVAGDAGFDYTNFANRQVVANIAELQGSETVTFTLKETTAQPIGSKDGTEVTFAVESSRTTTTSFALLSGDDNIDTAKLKVKQAADGSGSMVAVDADGTSVINVVRAGEALSDGIYFKFTPVGTMLNKGRIDLEIPTGWTAPVKEDGNAGGISIVGVGNNGAPSGSAPSGVTEKDPSDRIAFVDLTADIQSANSAFFIKYNNPTAPTVAGVYTFTARSRAQEGGGLLALSGGASPKIIVSPAGDGAGAMQIDKTEVAAATAGFVVKFTFTAADTMAGGELTVKIPDSWTPAKDKIKAGDGTTVGKITFKIDTREEHTHSFSLRDGDRTIAIPIASLNLRNQIIFTYEGTAQNVAGTATFETKTKLVNTGTLTPISATQPMLTVKNVAKGTGAVTSVNTGDPVDKTRVAAASTGNQITFDFEAVGTMDGGAVSMDVPGNWSPPQDVSGVAGYVIASAPLGGSVGSASVNGQNVTVPITTLGPGQIVRIVYGSGSGSSGAVAQDNAGGATFTFKSKGSGGDNFDDSTIKNQPTINVTNARDGSGTMTVARTGAEAGKETTATAGSVAEFVFTYTPAGTINGGQIQLITPDGWTAPNGDPGTRGFTIAETDPGASVGTLTFGENSVTVPISAISVGQTVRIKYGNGEGVNGVSVPAEAGPAVFAVKSQGLTDAQGGQLIELLSAPPVITIDSPTDGFGIATVSGGPYRGGSSGNTATIIFTANANVTDGSVSVDVPMGWTDPTADNMAVSSTGTIGGVPTYRDRTVTVDGVTLSADQTVTFTYTGVTVQGAMGSATFIVKSKGSAEGTLKDLVNVSSLKVEWQVSVTNAANGSGLLVAEPPFAVAGSTIDLKLIYTAVGTITGGVIRVTIPASWTTPQNVNVNNAGYVAVSASEGSVISTAIVSANVVVVPVTSLAPDGTVTVTYKKATAPAAEVSEFTGQSRGRGDGRSERLVAGPATVTVTEAADSLMVVSERSTVFANAVVAVALKLLKDGEAAGASEPVTVWLSADSTTGAFDTTMDGDFDGTVDSAVIPAGETWINVYYKDAVQGEVVITGKVAEFAEDMQMSTTTITISAGATALSLSTMGTLFSDGMVEIMLETQDDAGNPSASGTDVVVTLSSSSETGSFMVNGNPLGEDMTVTVMAGETSPMGTLTYTDTTVGMATLMATAEDLTDAMPLEVMVNNVIGNVTVEPMMAMAGEDVTVTAIAKPGLMPVPSFTVGDIVQTGIDMTESPDGTYIGKFTVVAEVHADGMYDVVVTVGEGEDAVTKTNGVTIDNTAPMITSGHDAPISAQNGDTVMLMVSSEEAGLTVMGTGVQAVDTMAESDSITFMESADTAGMYKAEFMISADNEADNGMYMISVTAMDAVDNTSAAVSISINLQNGAEFQLMVPDNISLIHIPLKVTSVDGENQMLEKISDLYDALGGSDNVSLLITYNSEAVRWDSYLGAVSMGGSANRQITGDLGILAAMKNEVTLMLQGEAWGEDGESMISLSKGTNLVGVPLDSDELDMVSDLLSDNVGTVIVSHEGEFMLVAAPGDSGDGPIEGSRSYIVTANAVATIPVTGEAWSSMPSTGITAAPVAIPHIVAVDGATPVLAIRGSITGESRGIAQVDLRITVRNLSTGASVSVVSGGEGDAGQYDVTFVDTKAARAAQVGDVLEIKAESPNPLIGVQPLRHIVSVDDVKNSRIQLTELVTYEIPAKTELLLNYPNPFNPETWIPFRLAEDSQVSLTIYDRTGRVVRSVDVGHRPAAVYESRAKAIYWDGRNDFGERVASGMYFYTLTAKDFSATRRMVILK